MPIKWRIHATVSIFHGDIYLQKLAVNSIKVTVAKGNNAQSETLCPFIYLHEMASMSSNYEMYFYTKRPAEIFKYRGMGILGTHGATWDSAQYFGYATLVITDSNLFQMKLQHNFFYSLVRNSRPVEGMNMYAVPPWPGLNQGRQFQII